MILLMLRARRSRCCFYRVICQKIVPRTTCRREACRRADDPSPSHVLRRYRYESVSHVRPEKVIPADTSRSSDGLPHIVFRKSESRALSQRPCPSYSRSVVVVGLVGTALAGTKLQERRRAESCAAATHIPVPSALGLTGPRRLSVRPPAAVWPPVAWLVRRPPVFSSPSSAWPAWFC